jgi:hypothetical protein
MIPMMATEAAGVSMDAIPSIRLEEGWNSNVYDTDGNEVSSFGTRLTPRLAIRFTTLDNVSMEISGSYEVLRYYESEARDANSNTWYLRVDSTGAWAFSPNFSMTPSVYYLNTSDSTRRTQLVPAGDPVIPPVTITNYGRAKTEDFGLGLNFNYLATQNVTVGVRGNYSEQRFSDTEAGSGLTDSSQAGGNVSVSYLFSQRTSLGILVAGNHQTYETAPDSNTLSAGILFGYWFSQALYLDGAFGWSYIRQSEAPGIPEEKSSAPSGLFNLSYIAESFRATAYGSAVYSGSSGFGEATRLLTAGIRFSDQITREWSWGLSGTYQVSRSVFETNAVDINSTFGTFVLRYSPWDWGSLDLTGNLNRQTSDGQFGENLDSYSALIGFTVGKPYRVF